MTPPALQENEMITLVLGCGFLIFILLNFKRLSLIVPSFALLFLSFFTIFLSEVFTNLEALICPGPMHFIEHICYALSGIFLFIWSYQIFSRPRKPS